MLAGPRARPSRIGVPFSVARISPSRIGVPFSVARISPR